MATRQAPFANRQFNSPLKLYSAENVADTLSKQTQVLANGALGIDFHQLAAPGNLANSAVLKMLEEEAQKGGKENTFIEYTKPRRRVQRFDWPPKAPDNDVNNNNNDEDFNNNNNKIMNNLNNINVCKNINNYKLNARTHHFNSTTSHIYTSPGLKRVAWPPLPENQNNIIEKTLVYSQEPVNNTSTNINQSQQQYQLPPHQPQQPYLPSQPQQCWAPPATPPAPFNPQSSPFNPLSPPAQQLPQEPVFQRIVQAPAPFYEPPPTFVTLRDSAPISQETVPVYESQPAATRGLGPRMRGDQKWPPAEQKAQAVEENQQRQALARGPAVRPRAVKKDYSKFFAQHALTTTYPGYRAPPGTQHYVEEGTSNF